MIQFNLLPDVKLDYIKVRRTKRAVISVAVLCAGVAIAITASLFVGVRIINQRKLNSLSEKITQKSKDLQNKPNLNKILTVQNQILSLNSQGGKTGLHDSKPVTSRLFSYLPKVTPNKLSISKLSMDFDQQTMEITGAADSIRTINKFVDTLKFTNYINKKEEKPTSKNAFTASSVVLKSFGFNNNEGDLNQKVSYEVSLKFDPAIFDAKQDVALKVPSIISTRSVTQRPEVLFKVPAKVKD